MQFESKTKKENLEFIKSTNSFVVYVSVRNTNGIYKPNLFK